ncbi:MAG TPA: hypothetical protein VK208_00665 [Pyrinomonadaceae bacterium]|nr:hypothetical protein [Pyrinomonadaceae bacterium]
MSNRSGFIARVELWLKGHLKRATRWYAWEQVNFNAAVHHALRDMVPILSAHEEEIRQLRAQADSRSQELERYQESLTSQLTHLQSELAALRSLGEAQKQQTQLQLSSLATELRERDEHLLEEQRVCFKQLSLETSEAAILEDRARRKAETVLEDLQRRIEQFEKGKK